ncbi:MAG TPA: two-component sensor histidine kinase, partial [Lachnospiraceae bacterium]|nr:two-component sensor histidine kinase [Lachnospiraceae bacterium]
LIARAVSNLISNAVKYGKDGKAVYIELEKYERELQIRVTNFGLVIPEESLEHIFDKFYRVEGSRSSQTGGTGLGLNIAQEIAMLHGGTITVKSGTKGTCFTIALPIDNTGVPESRTKPE